MKKLFAIVLALVMVATAFAGCSGKTEKAAKNDKPLVVGYSNFSSKFSPFFAETAYDMDASDMTQVALLNMDRMGSIIQKGIDGETIEYNGTEYTYYGPANLTITENDDKSVDYEFKLRDDMVFSDGEKLTADDVIFSMYVLSDPTYDGSSTLFAQPIKGMDAYRKGMEVLGELLINAGKDNKDFKLWDEATQTAFWGEFDAAGAAFAQSIVDYCIANGYNAEGDSVAACAMNWGYELKDDATTADFWTAILEAYDGDVLTATGTEVADKGFFDCFADPDAYKKAVSTGDTVDYIEGIQKIDDTTVKVTLTKPDATAIYNLGVNIAPLHYYGDKAKFDVEKHQFGFDKGDLSTVRAKTSQPLGAGPYKFIKFENGVISYEANENYYLGAPKTTNVQFRETTDEDKLNGVTTGTIDITDPSYSLDTQKAIKEANGGDITGDKITTSLVENLGYGFLAMSAKAVNVNGELGSDASKNLRKGLATVFALYRDVTVDSYYGDTAEVINYPISNTSWAAPQATDDGYQVAFSKDVKGNDIYTSDMDDAAKEKAALDAALGYLEAAGYTVKDGKVTAAPKGAKTEYTAWIPADGSGDHPSFMMLTLAKKAFAKIGIKINVKDLANSADLWTGIDADQVDMWCAAWGATPDPDMYQVYFSGDKENAPGGSQKQYDIDDKELNKLILEARESMDQSYRKTMYKECLDIVLDWGVEMPVYQRKNAVIFSTERVNIDTVTPDITPFYGWLKEVQNVELK